MSLVAKKSFFVLVGVLGLLFLNGCNNVKDSKDSQKQERQSIPVNVHVVSAEDIPMMLQFPARAKVRQSVDIIAKVPGFLEKKMFEEGSFVNKDKLLYQIEDIRYKAILEQAVANVAIQQSLLREASNEWDRVSKLWDEGVASQRERDTAKFALEQAKGSLLSAQAAVSLAQIDLDYTKIKAPISGIIGLNTQDIGSYVGTGASNSILATIVQVDPIEIHFSIPDNILSKKDIANKIYNVEQNISTSLIFSDGNEFEYKGMVDFVDSVVDVQTSSKNFRAIFPNPDNKILAGSFVRINLDNFFYKNAISIPQKALMQTQEGTFVYVVEYDKAIVKPVVVRATSEDLFIIESGLKEGDAVIVDRLMMLRPNSPVTVLPKGK